MLKRLLPLGLAAALIGCGDEDPVGLDGLVPDDAVRTLEVILDASAFLDADTAIAGFGSPAAGGYALVAEDYGGSLDAHALVRFRLPPASITYVDTAGSTKVDDSPVLVAGTVVARLDTLEARPDVPVMLALYRVAEAWDPGSAGWALRVDTGGVATPWTEAGGTRGALVDSATMPVGADSLVFAVDSATLALWSDTSDAARGALIESRTAGVRLRFNTFRLRYDARPSERPDTVVADSVSPSAVTFAYDPPPGSGGSLVVGGTPAWRSYLRLRDGLDTLTVTVPCSSDPQGCARRLADVTINYAALLLQPVAAPAGFAPRDSIDLEVRYALGGGQIPLARAPIGGTLTSRPVRLAGGWFEAGSTAPAELPITEGIREIVQATADEDEAPAPTTLALVDVREGGRFGIASFATLAAGAAAPRLRLIISVVSEDQVR